MRAFILILSIILLAGCSMRDIVTMDGATTQVNDLNDNDTDGVIVARERCNDTFVGATIDNYGCGKIKPINKRQELKILFPNDSFYIDPMYYDQVEVIATFMRQFPNTKVTIEGHSSKTGSYDHNLVLSQNRANAVTTTLSERFGIDTDRLTAIGYSFDRPIDFSETATAHTRNRRVIAEVTGEDTTADMKWNIYTVDEEVQ
ncbi:OmpA family protein [Shewanella sp. D64]|uniref:OmpA family protein n=1 Tax=unclassified Shewanella TaxID=196818 RepID=UPI0022BA32A4|nr:MULTISPECIES: OmpA family protein [unclassified Shewanella]MEC4727363.1 OmpA family protein [Shewanella sp. D64]MEC4739518.1 OmpA family protein [Shewanella sp. E94]WBJ96098.1 OmpA family protein [Shewanella sp. MTB7]